MQQLLLLVLLLLLVCRLHRVGPLLLEHGLK
jgi:hypothetical protein